MSENDKKESEGQNKPSGSESPLKDLLSAAKMGAKWMEQWLDDNECECEGGHFCGRDERMNELRIMKKAIAHFEC